METTSLNKDEWRRSLQLFQSGICALNTQQYRLAIVYLMSTLEWITPQTWNELWIETVQAIYEAYQKLYHKKDGFE